MAIPIKVKAYCNTHEFLYNKEKITPVLNIDKKRIAIRYDELGIIVLKPIIDKLSFGFSPTAQFLAKYDPAAKLEEYKAKIITDMLGDAHAEVDGLSFATGLPFMKSLYKHHLRYKPLNSGAESIYIQVGPKNEQSSLDFIKFELNPSHFSTGALTEFRAFIENKFITGVAPVSYAEFVIWVKIYRCDIAVDVVGVRPSDIAVSILKGGTPFPCKSHTYNSATGLVETLYLDAKKGKSSARKIYDKRIEQMEAGRTPLYGDCLHTRYESSVKKTTFYKLPNVQNPCGKISVKALDYRRHKKLSHVSQLFMHRALDGTLDTALNMIPGEHHAKYKQCYNEMVRGIWDADKIWCHWDEAVKSTGLFPAAK